MSTTSKMIKDIEDLKKFIKEIKKEYNCCLAEEKDNYSCIENTLDVVYNREDNTFRTEFRNLDLALNDYNTFTLKKYKKLTQDIEKYLEKDYLTDLLRLTVGEIRLEYIEYSENEYAEEEVYKTHSMEDLHIDSFYSKIVYKQILKEKLPIDIIFSFSLTDDYFDVNVDDTEIEKLRIDNIEFDEFYTLLCSKIMKKEIKSVIRLDKEEILETIKKDYKTIKNIKYLKKSKSNAFYTVEPEIRFSFEYEYRDTFITENSAGLVLYSEGVNVTYPYVLTDEELSEIKNSFRVVAVDYAIGSFMNSKKQPTVFRNNYVNNLNTYKTYKEFIRKYISPAFKYDISTEGSEYGKGVIVDFSLDRGKVTEILEIDNQIFLYNKHKEIVGRLYDINKNSLVNKRLLIDNINLLIK